MEILALDLRENGRGSGKEGKLKGVQGIGWWLDEANMAQISYNITDCETCSLHTVFEEVFIDFMQRYAIIIVYLFTNNSLKLLLSL